MLKTRVIPVVLYNGQIVVKSVQFDNWRNIGNPVNVVRVYNSREVDELVFLDVAATREQRRPDLDLLSQIAEQCFMPLTIGGGITSISDIRDVLMAGADKVCINSAAIDSFQIVRDGAAKFGNQCIVAALDAKKDSHGKYHVYRHSDRQILEVDALERAIQLEQAGAGELLLTSVDNDGRMEGYDYELIRAVSDVVSVPVIVAGGAGQLEHFSLALASGASALGAASIFHFTQHTPLEVKQHLKSTGIPVRA